MTSPTFREKGSKIEAKLLMHISKKSEPRGRDLSKNQENMMTSNMDDQNLLEMASNKLDLSIINIQILHIISIKYAPLKTSYLV